MYLPAQERFCIPWLIYDIGVSNFILRSSGLWHRIHSFTHGAEPFLRSWQLCSHSRTSQRFMEPEGSLPLSQETSTGPYPEPARSNLYPPILSKYDIVLPGKCVTASRKNILIPRLKMQAVCSSETLVSTYRKITLWVLTATNISNLVYAARNTLKTEVS
jgi:hypothetical protein